MADVQLEDGFAQIALALVAPLIGEDIPAGARAILAELVAGQYGPQKRRDVTFTASEIAERSGRHVKLIARSLRWLVEARIVVKVRANAYRLNKDFDQWAIHDANRRRVHSRTLQDLYGPTATHKRKRGANQFPAGTTQFPKQVSDGNQPVPITGDFGEPTSSRATIEDRASEELRLENKQQTPCAGVSPFNDLADEMCRIIGASWPTGEAFDEVARPLTISLDQHKPTKAAAIHLAYRAAKKQSPACWLLSVAASGGFVEPSRPLTPEGKPPPDKIANASAYKPAERIRDDTTPEDRAEALRIIRAKLGRSNGHSVKGA